MNAEKTEVELQIENDRLINESYNNRLAVTDPDEFDRQVKDRLDKASRNEPPEDDLPF